MQLFQHACQAWFDAGGHKSPPSAPPAIPPIVIDPFRDPTSRHIPNPAIDPLRAPPGPPIVPPRGPALRII
jgi:hypothetical protein